MAKDLTRMVDDLFSVNPFADLFDFDRHFYFFNRDEKDMYPYDVIRKKDAIVITHNVLGIEKEDLPFTSSHFVQNILSAVGACISLGIDLDEIKKVRNEIPVLKNKRKYLIQSVLITLKQMTKRLPRQFQ